jgi:predicted Zn finger-like uncharacterized protein
MRIACPTCAAAYEVPDALLAAGPRLLRCARCSTEFPAVLPAASARPGAAAPPEPVPESAPEAAPVPAPAPVPVPVPPDPPPAPDPAPPAPEPPASPAATPEMAVAPRERPLPTRGPAGPSPITPAEAPGASGQGRLAAAWIASFGAIGAGLFALLHWQAAIVAAWPPAARLYAALGLS